jgi:hypothetical protein
VRRRRFLSRVLISIVALRINLEALANYLLVDLVGMDVLEPDVAADRRAQAAMAQDLAHQLVVSGLLLGNDGAGGMPELVRVNSQTCELENALGDLAAEGDFALGTASQPGEQVVLLSALPALFLRLLLRSGDHRDRIRERLLDEHRIFTH